MSTETTTKPQSLLELFQSIKATIRGPYVKRGELASSVKPIRRHKANAELVWIETPFGNQWAHVGDIVGLDLESVPWD